VTGLEMDETPRAAGSWDARRYANSASPVLRQTCVRLRLSHSYWANVTAMFLAARASRFESAAVVVARTGSRAAVLRRSELTRFSSASDDKVGGFLGAIRSERQRAIKQRKNAFARFSSAWRRAIFRRSQLGWQRPIRAPTRS
jgi:hypothetical protein